MEGARSDAGFFIVYQSYSTALLIKIHLFG